MKSPSHVQSRWEGRSAALYGAASRRSTGNLRSLYEPGKRSLPSRSEPQTDDWRAGTERECGQ